MATEKPTISPVNKFNMISVQEYERYNPTAFNDSLTILEKINKMIYQLNNIGKVSNEVVEQWNNLIKWILGDGLNEIVSEEIQKKIDDGTFNDLFDSLLGNLDDLETIDKETVVAAINEVNKIATTNRDNIGDMSLLETVDNQTLVESINEVKRLGDINNQAVITIGEATGFGVISGFKIRQQNVLSMAVEVGDYVTPNIVHLPSGERYVLDSLALPVKPSSSTLNRIDIVYVSALGVTTYEEGISSLSPVPPPLPNGAVLLANINVVANDTTINDSDIVDMRPLKSLSFLKTLYKDNFVGSINELFEKIVDVATRYATKEELVNGLTTLKNEMVTAIGDLDELQTTDKSNIVKAINEVIETTTNLITELETKLATEIGDLASLKTDDKSNIVNAINEVITFTYTKIEELENQFIDDIGNINDLHTNNKDNIVAAINEIVRDYATKEVVGKLIDLKTVDKSSIVFAINEVVENVGDLGALTTTNKSDIVSALNEVVGNLDDTINQSIGDKSNLLTDTKENIVSAINEVLIKHNILAYHSRLADFPKIEFAGFVPPVQTGKYLQSICYIEHENVVMVGYKNNGPQSEDLLVDILKYSMDDFSLIASYKDLVLYHCNDMTYNPNTDELIVCTMTSPAGRNTIAIYDYSTMSLKQIKTVEGGPITSDNYIPTIAYAKDIDKYFFYQGQTLYMLNTDFTFNSSKTVKQTIGLILQTIEAHEGLVYIYFNGLIMVIDYEGKSVKNWDVGRYGEAEGTTYIGNGILLIGNITYEFYETSPRLLKLHLFENLDDSIWRTYSSLDELGIAYGTETIEELVYALADKTILIYDRRADNNAPIYPTRSGTVKITRYDLSKVIFEFYDASTSVPTLYRGSYNLNLSQKWSGWVPEGSSVLASGIAIPNGANLDDYKLNGAYYTTSGAITSSLLNLPPSISTAGIRLTVSYGASNNVFIQRLEVITGGNSNRRTHKEYVRSFNSSWSEWMLVTYTLVGSDTPEGVVVAPIGSIYINTLGGPDSTLYVKTTGEGSTGWTAK